jgi:cation:H+ antiporter
LLIDSLILASSFVVILIASELFTNGVEWLGERLGVAEAAVGSLLAAVGTALPETFIPLLALVRGRGHNGERSAVGVGAIIGAPLMLSTVAMLVMAVACLAFRKRRGRIALIVFRQDVRRDLSFFIPVFLGVTLLGVARTGAFIRDAIAITLLVVYAAYSFVLLSIRRDTETVVEQGLYLETVIAGAPLRPRITPMIVQITLALVGMLFGARAFVGQIVKVSTRAHLNPGILSLILSPLATELPEKYNSVVWIRQSKDHLAMANISGAMVFQSCIPVAFGLIFTPWHLTPPEILASVIALGSSALLYVNLRDREVGTPSLIIGGAAYVIFLMGLWMLGAF